ncbi:hypothetical protein GCM10011386_32360 [Parapedobacter defluvii]|uniref:Outer membrane protein beta-barrel domain-containing protein n=1 Tax=Parapedobacter defluvii TaxID=2045106 RepID=A0ABQ1MB13_9SPHI|nr:outer membrane beta-barrel protein [Parapedobacter defluvii]GGC37780.1 hypothetical protein GCM10011386_32360 [Parapedobacter defluvii]
MNESEENKELIQRIAETLRNYAEPYKEGAWERFTAAQGTFPKRVLWWPYAGAAAVLLMAAVLFLSHPGSEVPTVVSLESVTGETPSSGSASAEEPDTAEPEEPAHMAAAAQAEETKAHAAVSAPAPEVSEADERKPVAQLAVVQEEEVQEEDPGINERAVSSAETKGEATDTPPQRIALADQPETHEVPVTAVGKETHDDATRKWNLGLAVAPSMTSKKLNLGGGIAVAYQLSDKFSVGSGVTIGRLGMGENPNYDPSWGNPPQYDSAPDGITGLAQNREQYKRDVTLTSNVVALDIPLDFRYEVFKGLYTSVGISYVAVLSEERTEHFIGGLNETTFGSDKMVGKDLVASTTVGYRTEKMNTQPLKGNGYAGFMNFSVGRKMKLSKHIFFSIEPYFKLPIGQLSREQMDFTNGGVRIVTGF